MASRAWAIVSAVVVGSALGSISWGVPSVCSTGTNLTLGNSTLLAFIDTDEDGMPDSTDCRLFGKASQNTTADDGTVTSATCLNATQESSSGPTVFGCDEIYPGSTTVGDGNATAQNYGTRIEMSSSSSSGGNGGSIAGLPGLPVIVNMVEVFEQGNGQAMIGEGIFCSDGGLAVKATAGGVSGIVRFDPRTIPGFGNFYCGTVPFPTSESSAQPLPLCFPFGSDGNAAFMFEGGSTELITLQLTNLASCGNFQVPTASGWGLLGIAAALLALGTWLLRRRARFGAALPLV